MKNTIKNLKGLIAVIVMGMVIGQFIGCATIPEAIEYRNLYTNYKMTDTIFLDITKKATYRNVYVDVRNTSQLQEVDTNALKNAIIKKIVAKGYEVVPDVSKADYILQVNILYFDYYRKTGASAGAMEGTVAGGILGAAIGRHGVESLIIGAIGGAVAGNVGGALIGSAIKIETFAGVVDIQILEKTDKPVVGKIITKAKQGTSTTLQTEQEYESQYQTYRTQLAVVARQTNLKRDVAAQEIIQKISDQVAGIF